MSPQTLEELERGQTDAQHSVALARDALVKHHQHARQPVVLEDMLEGLLRHRSGHTDNRRHAKNARADVLAPLQVVHRLALAVQHEFD